MIGHVTILWTQSCGPLGEESNLPTSGSQIRRSATEL